MKNALQLQLPTGTWVLDTSATTVTIAARKLLAFRVPATLTVTAGTIEIVDGRVMSVDVVADASSYTSKNAKRNEDIVGPGFLDAANHPAIRFRADDVQSSATDGTAKGSVTVKGRATPIAVVISNIEIDGDIATFDASAVIDRAEIGVDKLPSSIIGQTLDLTVSATVSRSD